MATPPTQPAPPPQPPFLTPLQPRIPQPPRLRPAKPHRPGTANPPLHHLRLHLPLSRRRLQASPILSTADSSTRTVLIVEAHVRPTAPYPRRTAADPGRTTDFRRRVQGYESRRPIGAEELRFDEVGMGECGLGRAGGGL